MEYYQKTFEKSIKATIKENIYGSDILNYNVKRSRIILSLYGLLSNEIIEESDFNIYNQDSLKADWSTKFKVIVGNPPYVKFLEYLFGNLLLIKVQDNLRGLFLINFVKQMIQIFISIIKSKFTFFKVVIKLMFMNPSKSC